MAPSDLLIAPEGRRELDEETTALVGRPCQVGVHRLDDMGASTPEDSFFARSADTVSPVGLHWYGLCRLPKPFGEWMHTSVHTSARTLVLLDREGREHRPLELWAQNVRRELRYRRRIPPCCESPRTVACTCPAAPCRIQHAARTQLADAKCHRVTVMRATGFLLACFDAAASGRDILDGAQEVRPLVHVAAFRSLFDGFGVQAGEGHGRAVSLAGGNPNR